MVKMDRAFVFNITCIGYSHLKENKTGQDFSGVWASGKNAIAAVADGHGGDSYYRSDRGAQFAVEAALECIKEYLNINTTPFINHSKSLLVLEKSIIALWHKKVEDDVKNNSIEPIKGDIFTPYGTTLIAAAVTEHYWFAIQIGDGKCVVLDDETISQPIPWDEKCFLNQTTSLCDDDAISQFRHYYDENLPGFIFLGTDGIDDSFPIKENEKYLGKFYLNVCETLFIDNSKNFLTEDLMLWRDQLDEMLYKLSKKGSGDDISIAGIICKFINS